MRYAKRIVASGRAILLLSGSNALADTVNAELSRRAGPWRTIDDVELATLRWVHWWNERRLHGACNDVPPQGSRRSTTRSIRRCPRHESRRRSLPQSRGYSGAQHDRGGRRGETSCRLRLGGDAGGLMLRSPRGNGRARPRKDPRQFYARGRLDLMRASRERQLPAHTHHAVSNRVYQSGPNTPLPLARPLPAPTRGPPLDEAAPYQNWRGVRAVSRKAVPCFLMVDAVLVLMVDSAEPAGLPLAASCRTRLRS